MRVCFVGNSHIGALKQAYDKISGELESKAEVVFWGVSGTNFKYPDVHYKGGMLFSPFPDFSRMISGGRYKQVPVRDFDAVVFYGASLGITSTAQMLQWRLRARQNYSSRFFEAAANDLIKTSLDNMAVSKLVEDIPVADRPAQLVVCPAPLYAPSSKIFPKIEIGRDLTEITTGAMRKHFESMGAVFVEQPSETVDQGVYTKDVYSTNLVKMVDKVFEDNNDYIHMNAAYGEIVLRRLVEGLLCREAARIFQAQDPSPHSARQTSRDLWHLPEDECQLP